MGSHDGVAPGLHCTRRCTYSNMTLDYPPLISPSHFLLQQTLLPVRGRLQFFYPPAISAPILRFVLYCRSCLHLSIRLVHEPGWVEDAPPRITNAGQRRMAGIPSAYEEEDSVQLTKDEPGEAYKQ